MTALASLLLTPQSTPPTAHDATGCMAVCALLLRRNEQGLVPILPEDAPRARAADGYCGDHLKRVEPGEVEALSLASRVQEHPEAPAYLMHEGTLLVLEDGRLIFRGVYRHSALERAYRDVRYGTLLGLRHRLPAEHLLTFEQVPL